MKPKSTSSYRFVKRYVKTFVTVLAVAATCGCGSPRPAYIMQSSFDEQEFAPYTYKGTASIQGQAFLKTRGGDVRYGAGNAVLLTPATSYIREIVQLVEAGRNEFEMINGRIPTGTKSKLIPHMKIATADGSGNFSFSGLSPGNYYVECGVFWSAGNERTGGVVRKLVKVNADESVKIVLTDR